MGAKKTKSSKKMVNTNSKLNKVYETDASQMQGKTAEVIIPENIAEMQEIVRKHTNITPRGAGTGLAGGAVPLSGVVIDLSKFDKIKNINPDKGVVEVEAGCILDNLNYFLEKHGLEFPVQPSSHKSCTIGGMIATDAVGSRAGKYGRTSRWIEWIEVMDNEGMIKRIGKTELSEFSGLEGTTGIILSAGLKLIPKPERTISIFKRERIEEIISFTREFKRNQNISMIEFIGKDVSSWIGLEKAYHLIVEYESNEGKLIGEEYTKALGLRDKIYPVLAERGNIRIEDPKLFLDKIPDLVKWLEHAHVPVYGHISVGILHPCFSKSQEKLIPEMMKLVKKLNGQVSGEHGIGIVKREFVEEQDKKLFSLIKERRDSKHKFNPGKIVK